MNEMLEAALELAGAGYPVFPILPRKKKPAILRELGGRGFHDATTDPTTINQWWSVNPKRNIGLATGGDHRLVVVDIDPKNGGDESWTDLVREFGEIDGPRVLTPSGGVHIYAAAAGDVQVKTNAGVLGTGIDVRAEGGYVVAPPSELPNGRYTWEVGFSIFDRQLEVLPQWIINRLSRPKADPRVDTEGPAFREGTRNTGLTRLAGMLRRFGATYEELLEMLLVANEHRCVPPLDRAEVESIARSVVKYEVGRDVAATLRRPTVTLREIDLTNKLMHQVTNEITAVLEAANEPVSLVRYADEISELVGDGDGVKCRRLDRITGRATLDRRFRFVRSDRRQPDGKRVPVSPLPLALVDDFLAQANPPFPTLEGIVSAPYLGTTRRIVTVEGFDSDSGYFLSLPRELKGLSFPDAPTAADVKDALDWVEQILGDFPFEAASDRAAAIAVFLTLPIAPSLQSPIPPVFVNATVPGAGKGLLLDACTEAFLGKRVPRSAFPESDAEVRKLLTSAHLARNAALHLDNLVGPLRSAAFDSYVTSEVIEDRALGTNKMLHLTNRMMIMISANNGLAGGDTGRRLVPIRLEPGLEAPELRTGFRHPDLMAWIRENRREIVRAALVLIQNWIARGTPPGSAVMGSFESWAKTVGGILEAAGVEGFLENRDDFRSRGDLETLTMRKFVDLWFNTFRTDVVKSTALLQIAMTMEIPPFQLTEDSSRSNQTRMGHFVRSLNGRVFDRLKVTSAGEDRSSGGNLWQLTKLGSD